MFLGWTVIRPWLHWRVELMVRRKSVWMREASNNRYHPYRTLWKSRFVPYHKSCRCIMQKLCLWVCMLCVCICGCGLDFRTTFKKKRFQKTNKTKIWNPVGSVLFDYILELFSNDCLCPCLAKTKIKILLLPRAIGINKENIQTFKDKSFTVNSLSKATVTGKDIQEKHWKSSNAFHVHCIIKQKNKWTRSYSLLNTFVCLR